MVAYDKEGNSSASEPVSVRTIYLDPGNNLIYGYLDHFNISLLDDSGEDPDQVWGFPLFFDGLRPRSIAEKEVFPIEESGDIFIDLDELSQQSYVFVLASSEAEEREDRIVGFLAVTGENHLNSFHVDDIEKSINLGLLNPEGDEVISTSTIEEIADSFANLSSEDLKAIAAEDDVVKVIKNLYINYHGEDHNYNIQPYFLSRFEELEIIKNDFVTFEGGFNKKAGINIHTQEKRGEKVFLSPDGQEVLPLGTSDGDLGKVYHGGPYDFSSQEGYWKLVNENDHSDVRARADLSINYRFNEDDFPMGFIPFLQVNVEEDGFVESISVEWRVVGEGPYQETISNLDILELFIVFHHIEYEDFSGNTKIVPWDCLTEETLYFNEEIKFSDIRTLKLYFDNMVHKNEVFINRAQPGEPEAIYFEDPELELVVREAIQKPEGLIYPEDVEGLKELAGTERGIKKLGGIEYLKNLERLALGNNEISSIELLAELENLEAIFLQENQISDLAPLSALTKVEKLLLFNNEITDIEPLSELTALETLSLYGNLITDISGLSDLENLKVLGLYGNDIENFSGLSGLTSLETLDLSETGFTEVELISGLINLKALFLMNNEITDIGEVSGLINLESFWVSGNKIIEISVLSGLEKLKELNLNDNEITDIGALVDNEGIGEGDLVNIKKNYLDIGDENSEDMNNINALKARGVTVRYSPQK